MTDIREELDVASIIYTYLQTNPTEGDKRQLLLNIAADLELTITIHPPKE